MRGGENRGERDWRRAKGEGRRAKGEGRGARCKGQGARGKGERGDTRYANLFTFLYLLCGHEIDFVSSPLYSPFLLVYFPFTVCFSNQKINK